jgi:uncharacterized OB-fold protein
VTDDPILRPQPVGIPAPQPSLASAPYWEATARHELLYQACERCDTVAQRPTTVCGACLDRSLSWRPSTGLGSLYSWTVVHRPQRPTFVVPYAPAIVTFDEGFRLVTSVIGCRPDELVAGLRVAVEFHPASDDIVLPYVRPIAPPA